MLAFCSCFFVVLKNVDNQCRFWAGRQLSVSESYIWHEECCCLNLRTNIVAVITMKIATATVTTQIKTVESMGSSKKGFGKKRQRNEKNYINFLWQ